MSPSAEPAPGQSASKTRVTALTDRGCQLVCVPPDKVALIWPRVRGLILAAMRRGDLSSFEPVESSVLAGHALLWLAIAREDGRERPEAREDGRERPEAREDGSERRDGDGVQVHAAAVTELHQTEWRKVCVIVACGGSDTAREEPRREGLCRKRSGMSRWLHLIEPIEEFARAENCAAMRIMGRKGWARVLTGYRAKRIVLEKDL